VVAGDDFGDFVTAELKPLLKFARFLTGNYHDAWDLTQECLVRVGARWAHVDSRGNPGAYARTTLIRLNTSRLRRLRRERLGDLSDTQHPVATDETSGYEPWLEKALAELSPRQRAAVALRYIEDLPIADAARMLGCTEATFKTHLRRAMQALREADAESEARN
jgi:RNA polymerase sigma factor (sigma-70 family)